MDEERDYVRAMLGLMRRMADEMSAAAQVLGPGAGPADLHEAEKDIPWRYLRESEALTPPASLAAFHAEYVAHMRESLSHPPERLGTSQRMLMPDGHRARAERGMELLRVLMAVATDEDMAAAGMPPEGRWQFVAGDEANQPREQLVMADKEGPDWREKLQAEMRRRGIPERDIEETMRRLERLRDAE